MKYKKLTGLESVLFGTVIGMATSGIGLILIAINPIICIANIATPFIIYAKSKEWFKLELNLLDTAAGYFFWLVLITIGLISTILGTNIKMY